MGRRSLRLPGWSRRLLVVACVGFGFYVASEHAGTDEGPAASEAAGLPDTVALPSMLASMQSEPTQSESSPTLTPSEPDTARPEPVVQSSTPALRTATFAFTGDTLLHSPLVERARANAGGSGYDFTPMFARVAPTLSSVDAALCHLETPVAPAGERLTTFPAYGVPAEIAPALFAAGYDRCSTASNHSIDRGAAGVDATIDALEAAGLTQAGMARSPEESTATLIDVNGITIAHLSYTDTLNGLRRPPDQLWRVNVIDDGRVTEDAERARAAGADVVIVSLHWGTERSVAVTERQRNLANLITASGQVDLIVGHHAHVIQPIEQVNGVWVVYGMGNFLSNMPTGGSWPASTQDGAIFEVAISEQADGHFVVDRPEVIPTWVDRSDGWVIRPVTSDLDDPTVSEMTKVQLLHSLDRTTAVVGAFIRH